MFDGNEDASVTLSFNGSDFARSSARNIVIPGDDNNYYMVVTLSGDYKQTKQIQFSEHGTYSVTFNAVPLGAEISVEANVYEPNANEPISANEPTILHTFTGSSPKQVITQPVTGINLQMKNLQDVDFGNAISINSSEEWVDDASTYGGKTLWNSFALKFYPNGKYKIYGANNQTISEGLYTGNPEIGNTILLREYLYRECSVFSEEGGSANEDAIDLEFGNVVLVEYPQNISVYIGEDNYNIHFTLSSQISFVFKQGV